MLLSFEATVVDADVMELVSFDPSSCTSSIEDADIRCAVSNGDLAGMSSLCGSVSSSLGTFVGLCGSSNVAISLGARGVETVEERRPLVSERAELDECRDCGRDVVSGASSNVSCRVISQRVVCLFTNWAKDGLPLLCLSFRRWRRFDHRLPLW